MQEGEKTINIPSYKARINDKYFVYKEIGIGFSCIDFSILKTCMQALFYTVKAIFVCVCASIWLQAIQVYSTKH